MSESEAIHIRYLTEVTKARTGIRGNIIRFAANHPYALGAIGGTLGVVVALIRSPGVIESAPLEATFIGGLVIVVWTFLCGMMRRFFEALTWVTHEVIRELVIDENRLEWNEGETKLRTIEQPKFQIFTIPVPDSVQSDSRASEQPWKVWVVAKGSTDQWVLTTKVTALEAKDYSAVSEEIESNVDEKLPTHIASPILILGRNESGIA